MNRILTLTCAMPLFAVACTGDLEKTDTADTSCIDTDITDTEDTGLPCLSETTRWYFDGDSDGWGLPAILGSMTSCTQPGPEYVLATGDCDDSNPNINPDASDPANDGIDWDCDGSD